MWGAEVDEVIVLRAEKLMQEEGYDREEALEEAEFCEKSDFEKALDGIHSAEYSCFRYENGHDIEENGLSFDGIIGLKVDEYDGNVWVDDEFFSAEHVAELERAISEEVESYNRSHYRGYR